MTLMRELTDKELDAVCGGLGIINNQTQIIRSRQTNLAVVAASAGVSIVQVNNVSQFQI